jgi:predicted RNA-binding protein YlxR (DUF448 family)
VSAGRDQPVRTCVGCGKRAAQHEFLRLQRLQAGVDGTMLGLSPRRAGVGRSAYVHRRRSCVDGLAKSRLLARSLRAAVQQDVREEIARVLRTMLRDETIVGETRTAAPAGNG